MVGYQVAAPTESRTPVLQRATTARQRLRMEGWRQRWLGYEVRVHRWEPKTVSTPTGLLMGGPSHTVEASLAAIC